MLRTACVVAIVLLAFQAALAQNVRIQNAWRTDQEINIETGSPQSSPTEPGWLSAQWVLEAVPGTDYVRIRSVWTGVYLNVETGALQSTAIEPGWLSAQWRLVPMSIPGTYRIENVWTNVALHIEQGSLVASDAPQNWQSAVWSLNGYGDAPSQQRMDDASTSSMASVEGEWIWRVGDEAVSDTPTIRQDGSNLEITIGDGKVNALLVGNTFSLDGVKATVSQSGNVITLENGMEWARAREVKARFRQALARATVGSLQTIDGPNKLAVGDGELSVENHVNGMATMGPLYIVNYPNYSRDKGRLLFWHSGTGNWSPVHTFSMASRSSTGGNGYPATMDVGGRYLVVATGDSGFVKFFDSFVDGGTPRELEGLELSVGQGVEDVGLAYDPRSKRFLLYASNVFWVSIGNTEADLSTATGWQKVATMSGENIPHGEAGTPLRSLGGGLFALLSLGSDTDNDSYAYRLSFVTLNVVGAGAQGATVTKEVISEQFTMANPGEAGGAPSFRWGGTAEVDYSNKEFVVSLIAAPKRLDASGNYYKWSSR